MKTLSIKAANGCRSVDGNRKMNHDKPDSIPRSTGISRQRSSGRGTRRPSRGGFSRHRGDPAGRAAFGQVPHPDGLDEPDVALSQDRYFSYWTYARGHYEIDDDIWGLFVTVTFDNARVVADVSALLSTRKFVKEDVDFSRFE